jgi:hypothetical protein
MKGIEALEFGIRDANGEKNPGLISLGSVFSGHKIRQNILIRHLSTEDSIFDIPLT